jgi:hypothetical protein
MLGPNDMLLAPTKSISRTRSLRCPSHASRGERRGFMQRFGLGVNRSHRLRELQIDIVTDCYCPEIGILVQETVQVGERPCPRTK